MIRNVLLGSMACITAFLGAQIAGADMREPKISEPRHIELRSEEGVRIGVDYRTVYQNTSSNKPSEYWRAEPLTFEVSGEFIRPGDPVRLVIINKVRTDGQCGIDDKYDEYTYYLDLRRGEDGVYRGNLHEDAFILWGIGDQRKWEKNGARAFLLRGAYYCVAEEVEGQEVAVVVNGYWLNDPISRSHNFRTWMEWK